MEDNVRVHGLAAQRQSYNWQMISDILGGTPAMRRAAQRWLPREEKESEKAYAIRLERSFFYNAFRRAAKLLSSHPFSKPVQMSKQLPARLQPWLDDIDLQGSHFDVFALRAFFSAVCYGQTHILVDMPPRPESEVSLADQRRNARRPYFVEIAAHQVLGFRYEMQLGRPVLTQLRILETVQAPAGNFADTEVEQVRVLYPGAYELWQKIKDKWEVIGGGELTLKKIPLVTLTTGEPLGFMEAQPPLMDLALENLAHWQSSSDQRHILHVARVPILFASGIPAQEGENQQLVVSPNALITAPDKDASLRYVEHTGAAINAGHQDILDIENRMAVLALEPLVRRDNDTSATESILNAEGHYADLNAMVRNCEDAFTAALDLMSEWMGDAVPTRTERLVTLNTDFAIGADAASDLTALLQLRTQRQITQETLLREFQRRKKLDPSLDLATEIAKTLSEAPRFDAMGDVVN